jgi:hypothetical protein
VIVTIKVKNKKATQVLTGQLLRDMKHNTTTLFTDEELLITPYLVQIGDGPRKVMFARELVGGEFVKHIRGTQRTRKLGIFSLDSKLQVSIIKKDRREFEMKYRVGCPLFKAELYSEDGNVDVWTRNGAAIVREGGVHREGVVTIQGRYENMADKK